MSGRGVGEKLGKLRVQGIHLSLQRDHSVLQALLFFEASLSVRPCGYKPIAVVLVVVVIVVVRRRVRCGRLGGLLCAGSIDEKPSTVQEAANLLIKALSTIKHQRRDFVKPAV